MLEYYRFKQVADLFLAGKGEEAKIQLAELQRLYVKLCDENLTRRTQLQEYEDILYLERNLFFDDRYYWLVTGGIKQGPFCPSCYNKDGLLVRLAGEPHERYCTYCQQSFVMEHLAAAVPMEPEEKKSAATAPLASRGRGKVIPFSR